MPRSTIPDGITVKGIDSYSAQHDLTGEHSDRKRYGPGQRWHHVWWSRAPPPPPTPQPARATYASSVPHYCEFVVTCQSASSNASAYNIPPL
eukprot:1178-Rhodomonas_salina.1